MNEVISIPLDWEVVAGFAGLVFLTGLALGIQLPPKKPKRPPCTCPCCRCGEQE